MLVMLRHLTRSLLTVAAVALAGCQSDEMVTRTYRLRDPAVDARRIDDVLTRERKEHGTPSSSSVTPAGDAVVKTTPAVQQKVQDAIGQPPEP